MNFNISCDLYSRFSKVCHFLPPSVPEGVAELIKCIRLENINGKSYAIVTNQKIGCIEYLGETTEPDGFMHLVVDETLMNQSESEKTYGSTMNIVNIEAAGVASLTTMLGFSYAGNASAMVENHIMSDWRKWAHIEEVKKAKGALYFDLDYLSSMAKASPTGRIYFAEKIDVDKPIPVRDIYNDNWVGVFIGKPNPNEKDVPAGGAKAPEWWVK